MHTAEHMANHRRLACTPPTPLVIIERVAEGGTEGRGLQRPLCINMRVTHWTIVVVLTVTAVECGTSNMCRRKRESEKENARSVVIVNVLWQCE